METTGVIAEIEAGIMDQLALAGGDPAVGAAGEAMIAALRPAVSGAIMALVEQAAAEVRAQLVDHEVDVVVRDGEPSILVRDVAPPVPVPSEDPEARMTVRLPAVLKSELESAAGDAGESINGYVVKALAAAGRSGGRRGRRITTTFDT